MLQETLRETKKSKLLGIFFFCCLIQILIIEDNNLFPFSLLSYCFLFCRYIYLDDWMRFMREDEAAVRIN